LFIFFPDSSFLVNWSSSHRTRIVYAIWE
jgi:hypothetical protein